MLTILSCLQGFKKYWKLKIPLKEFYLLLALPNIFVIV